MLTYLHKWPQNADTCNCFVTGADCYKLVNVWTVCKGNVTPVLNQIQRIEDAEAWLHLSEPLLDGTGHLPGGKSFVLPLVEP
jgi:hypothetical protein